MSFLTKSPSTVIMLTKQNLANQVTPTFRAGTSKFADIYKYLHLNAWFHFSLVATPLKRRLYHILLLSFRVWRKAVLFNKQFFFFAFDCGPNLSNLTIAVWITQPFKASLSYRWLQITAQFYPEHWSVRCLLPLFGKVRWFRKVNAILSKYWTHQRINRLITVKVQMTGTKKWKITLLKRPFFSETTAVFFEAKKNINSFFSN